jgi:hypothetical protein
MDRSRQSISGRGRRFYALLVGARDNDLSRRSWICVTPSSFRFYALLVGLGITTLLWLLALAFAYLVSMPSWSG